ncbi:GHMP kinase [Maribacter sp. 4U21]|uniref:GYDIA family GHMP kinase n=1 Tax=Maribacter sp. 4U21 TaxID=1889779 RepID=UPI000C162581|nr:GYDIA family GHMP kinase [Maribacter sp. 4U21]PIB23333.1 GHMP kinase [Maribacter sp. 4U21]
MTKEFYSNGKLLLSGEYAILDGAEGWAIPTKYGQHLKVNETNTKTLSWRSIDADGTVWFTGSYTLKDFKEIASTNEEISKNLIHILNEIRKLEPNFLTNIEGCKVQTELTFPRVWGLGTSSTLIANLSSWAKVDPYALLSKTFGGSAYDIACAQNDGPIIFQLKDKVPIITNIDTTPPFTEALFFIYLNQKKNSREAIAAYRNLKIDKAKLTQNISELTRKMISSQNLRDFEELLNTHERRLSRVLQTTPIKEKLFKDYHGSIKSLGAWGGDFILATGNEETPEYFKSKGYSVVLPFSKMIL